MKRALLVLLMFMVLAGAAFAAGGGEEQKAKGKYLIAFSQATMTHPWRVTMNNDMELWAKKSGVEFIWLDGNDDPPTQLNGVKNLLTKKPDLLFASPCKAEPMSPIVQWCKDAKVPLICIDRGLSVEPDGQTYLSFVIADLAWQHYDTTLILIDKIAKKNGGPKGTIVELMGSIGSSAANDQHRGLTEALKQNPGIKVVASQAGDYDRNTSLRVVENWLKMYPKGSIDGISCANDESALGAIQAVKEAGRTELLGFITGVNGQREALKAMLDGEMLCTNMNGPYWGEASFTAAMNYLQKGTKPDKYIMVLMPSYRADLPNELKRVKEAYDYCVLNNVQYPPISVWVESGKRLGLPIENKIPAVFRQFYGLN